MHFHCRRCALTAVCIICYGVFIFFKPRRIYICRFSLFRYKTCRINSICNIHRPVLLVINIPSNKIMICIRNSQAFGRRQIKRTICNIVYGTDIFSPAVKLNVVCNGGPKCVKGNAFRQCVCCGRRTICVVILCSASVCFTKISAEYITRFIRFNYYRHLAVIGCCNSYTAAAAMCVQYYIICIRRPLCIERNCTVCIKSLCRCAVCVIILHTLSVYILKISAESVSCPCRRCNDRHSLIIGCCNALCSAAAALHI